MRELIWVGSLRLDMLRCEVITPDKMAHLTPLEMWLLGYLAAPERVNTTVSAGQISAALWDDASSAPSALIKVFIHHIQRKIEQGPMHPLYLLRLPGEGFKLVISRERS